MPRKCTLAVLDQAFTPAATQPAEPLYCALNESWGRRKIIAFRDESDMRPRATLAAVFFVETNKDS